MSKEVIRLLEEHQFTTEVEQIQSISGGSINDAYYVLTRDGEYFVKTNKGVPSHFFRVEAKGLKEIEASETIKVPHVHYYNEPENQKTGILILDWVEGQKAPHTDEELGHNLAKMHRTYHTHFGYGEDTFIGELPQPNGWFDSWMTYYRERRLYPQYEMALERGRVTGTRKKRMEQLLDQLDRWIPDSPRPSLLHGDLWGGNWIVGPGGAPYLIDPSILYGDHLFEMAFTELFGGFSHTFYRAYAEVFPLPDYYNDVKPLYQLYYLLVHLNLFGEGYGRSVDRILLKYV